MPVCYVKIYGAKALYHIGKYSKLRKVAYKTGLSFTKRKVCNKMSFSFTKRDS